MFFSLQNNIYIYIYMTFLVSLADYLEQPLSMPHEEKRKLTKGFQNGISPSDPSTQTLVKEV